MNFGLPNESTMYNNGKVKYDPEENTWTCAMCNYKRDKYNRKQVTNRVNTKHNINNTNTILRRIKITKIRWEW